VKQVVRGLWVFLALLMVSTALPMIAGAQEPDEDWLSSGFVPVDDVVPPPPLVGSGDTGEVPLVEPGVIFAEEDLVDGEDLDLVEQLAEPVDFVEDSDGSLSADGSEGLSVEVPEQSDGASDEDGSPIEVLVDVDDLDAVEVAEIVADEIVGSRVLEDLGAEEIVAIVAAEVAVVAVESWRRW